MRSPGTPEQRPGPCQECRVPGPCMDLAGSSVSHTPILENQYPRCLCPSLRFLGRSYFKSPSHCLPHTDIEINQCVNFLRFVCPRVDFFCQTTELELLAGCGCNFSQMGRIKTFDAIYLLFLGCGNIDTFANTLFLIINKASMWMPLKKKTKKKN